MTTATVSASTEAEIRAAIRTAIAEEDVDLSHDEVGASLRHLAILASDPLRNAAGATLETAGEVWEPVDDPEPNALWVNLRPSEAIELRDAILAAAERCEVRCLEVITEELVAVGVAFAAAHPDAPRPAR